MALEIVDIFCLYKLLVLGWTQLNIIHAPRKGLCLCFLSALMMMMMSARLPYNQNILVHPMWWNFEFLLWDSLQDLLLFSFWARADIRMFVYRLGPPIWDRGTVSPSEGQWASFGEKPQMVSAPPDCVPWGQWSQQGSCSTELRGSSYCCSKAGGNENHHKNGRKINICSSL